MENNDTIEWSGRSRGGSFGYSFFIWLIKTAGIRFSYFFLSFVVIYFIPAAPKATAAVWNYYRKIHKRGIFDSAFSVIRHYYRFGQTLIDKIAISAGLRDRYTFGFKDYDRFLEILNSGRGVVMIGAHIGNWEAGSVFFGDYASRMNIVLYDSEYGKIKQALQAGGIHPEFNIIPVNGDSIESVLKIKAALDRGEYVCFQGDRFINEEKTVEKEFMGRDARFPLGPFLTASRMKVPVVFYYAMRGRGRRYDFIFREAQYDPSRGAGKPEISLMEDYLRTTEAIVREYPDQWFNFYKFWG